MVVGAWCLQLEEDIVAIVVASMAKKNLELPRLKSLRAGEWVRATRPW